MKLLQAVKSLNPHIRFLVVVMAPCIMVCIFLVTIVVFTFFSYSVGGFSGYRAILVPISEDPTSVESAITDGVGPVVSKRSATVRVSVFSGMQSIAISELNNRLEPLDPRFDQYMRRIPAFFQTLVGGEQFEIMYVESSVSPNRLAMWLRQNGFSHVIIHGVDVSHRISVLAGFVLLAGVLIWLSRGARVTMLLVCLPWAVLIGGGWTISYLPGIAVALGCYYGLRTFVPHVSNLFAYGQKNLPIRELYWTLMVSTLSIIAVLISLAVAGVDARLFIGIAVSLGYVLVVFAAALGVLYHQHATKSHLIFTPVTILSELKSRPMSRKPHGHQIAGPSKSSELFGLTPKYIPAFVCLLVLIGIPYAAEKVRSAVFYEVPAPVAVAGISETTWEDIERLSLANHVRILPDLADYVTHEAFQFGLPYGRDFRFPFREEVVYQSDYSVGNGAVVHSLREVIVYDENWFSATLASASGSDMGAMLMAQARLTGVNYSPSVSSLLSSANVIISFMILLSIALHQVRRLDDLTAQLIYGISSNISRRKRQAA